MTAVKNDGTPQPYDKLTSHLRKPQRSREQLKSEEWSKHLEDLRAISVLANQATEYVYNKNKTESKTGAIKPDLIPQEKRTSVETKKSQESPKKTESPKKSILEDVKKTVKLEHLTKELATKLSPEKLKFTKDSGKLIKSEQMATQAAAKVSGNKEEATTTATTTSNTKGSEITGTTSPKTQGSPSKIKAKPTEIKKPGVIDTGRLKANKLLETVTSPIEAVASELEKIAAAKLAEKSKSKSPTSTKTINDKPTNETKELNTNDSTTKETEQTKEKLTTQVKQEQPEVNITTAKVENKTTAAPPATAAGPSSSSLPSAIKDNAKRPSLKRHKDSLTECKPLNVLVYAETATAKESAVNTLKEILADNT